MFAAKADFSSVKLLRQETLNRVSVDPVTPDVTAPTLTKSLVPKQGGRTLLALPPRVTTGVSGSTEKAQGAAGTANGKQGMTAPVHFVFWDFG
tara:strand:+ start:73878 stop:74156 length:279 start_codon:yes stop_codon:yes gene_type:complete